MSSRSDESSRSSIVSSANLWRSERTRIDFHSTEYTSLKWEVNECSSWYWQHITIAEVHILNDFNLLVVAFYWLFYVLFFSLRQCFWVELLVTQFQPSIKKYRSSQITLFIHVTDGRHWQVTYIIRGTGITWRCMVAFYVPSRIVEPPVSTSPDLVCSLWK